MTFENKNRPITYLVGALVGVNAIEDSYLWVDAPDCFFFKTDFIHGNHDITSKLRKEDGRHKVLSTIADADNVIDNNNDKFAASMKQIAREDFVRQVFVSSMPMSQVIGTDYDGIIKEVVEETGKPVFNVPSRSMTDCWLEGYSDVLFSLAKNVDIEGGEQEENNVAIVGNLFDRGEGDCIANVQELRRIVEALGLKCVSIWLDGGKFDDILEIKHAQTIISLPYGRKASKKIAKRLGAKVLELDIPFGLDQTGEFIRGIADHFGKQEIAEMFITSELTEYNKLEIIKWAIPHAFTQKKMGFYGDPYLLNGFMGLAKTLGFSVENIFVHGDEKHFRNIKNMSFDLEECKTKIKYGLNGEDNPRDIDLFILNSHHHMGEGFGGMKTLEFGFPSYYYHVYTYEPYYGYRGTLKFMNRISNVITGS